jgi:hypothetical protein
MRLAQYIELVFERVLWQMQRLVADHAFAMGDDIVVRENQ